MNYKLKRNYTEVGNFLQKKRRAAGITQREISLKLGYSSAQFISNFERGIALPPVKKLKVIIKAYGIEKPEITNLIIRAERRILEEGLRR